MDGLQSMDGVDIRHVFRNRPLVMTSVPKFMQGAFRAAFESFDGRNQCSQIGTGRVAPVSGLEGVSVVATLVVAQAAT